MLGCRASTRHFGNSCAKCATNRAAAPIFRRLAPCTHTLASTTTMREQWTRNVPQSEFNIGGYRLVIHCWRAGMDPTTWCVVV
mgnify:CR=1 FL=1